MTVNLTPQGTRGPTMSGGPLKGVFVGLMVFMHRRGLMNRMDGLPVLLLTTLGARSGRLRTTPVMAFPEGADSWLVVASNGGGARHPFWVVNMARNPDDVWIGAEGRKIRVTPTSLDGAEREEAWASIVRQSGRFGGYEKKTDREIPVVRLRAVS